MKLFIYELYLRDCVGLKDIKETNIKRVDKKECYIIDSFKVSMPYFT